MKIEVDIKTLNKEDLLKLIMSATGILLAEYRTKPTKDNKPIKQKKGRGRPPKQWRKEDIEYLKKEFEKSALSYIARKIGKGIPEVERKAKELGL